MSNAPQELKNAEKALADAKKRQAAVSYVCSNPRAYGAVQLRSAQRDLHRLNGEVTTLTIKINAMKGSGGG